ncbi:MAG: DUF1571 domain-containing protein [Planctomycetaceae bacterium]|nr:DUF1571 domain-containing protein [Planctomycetaceae bacterium]
MSNKPVKVLGVRNLLRVCAAVCLLSGVTVLCQEPAAETTKSEAPPQPAEHPLIPVIRWAERERPKIADIKGYTATVQKQECIGGVVQGFQIMETKVRHNPFSVYIKFRFPKEMNGQEAIYVRGQNDSKLFAHGVGVQKMVGTLKLDPNGILAMRGNKYPITEMGILNLVDKLLEVGRKDSQYGECDVSYKEDCKIGGVKDKDGNYKKPPRECTLIQVTHPVPRKEFIFHIARIYVDKELNVPIQYESYDWAKKAGEPPMLIEAYSYIDLNLNVKLTDEDFDYQNPKYSYPKLREKE